MISNPGADHSSFLSLPDGKMYYEESGAGTAVVFLHAGLADSRMWEPQRDFFVKQYRTVRCDLRGYGRSQYPDAQFSYADDLLALVDSLDLDEFVLVGASFGARVSVDFYFSFPERVRGMVLVSPVVTGFEPAQDVEEFNQKEGILLEEGRLQEAVELNMRMWVDGPYRSSRTVDPALRKFIAEMQLQAFSQPLPNNTSLRHVTPTAISRLKDVQVPLLIISGEQDVRSFVEFASAFAQQAPDTRRVIIPNAAHMVSMEAPLAFNQAVSSFLASLSQNH